MDDEFLIEYKRTDSGSITIKDRDLEELRTNALLEGRTPLMGIELKGRDWTLIETAEFERRRSIGAGGGLGTGELSHRRPGGDVSSTRQGPQEAAQGRQIRLSRARRPQSLPDPGSVS